MTDDEQQTRVSNPVVDTGDTSESPALGDTTESAAVAPEPEPAPTRAWAPPGGESPAQAQQRGAEAASDPFNDRPHVWVAGAFVAGFVFARVLKRLGRGDG